MGVIELVNVSLERNGSKLLKDLSIQFKAGKINAVIGQNGAGKSTLVQTIMGLPEYRNFEGDIQYNGSSVKDLSLRERAKLGITLAWQEPARFNGIDVSSFISAGAKKKGTETVRKFLDLVGLPYSTYAHRYVDKTLSGGERKRIELASIAAMEPSVILMDEPDSGVDIEAIRYIFNVITYLKSKNITVFIITHSIEVLKKADYAYLLCSGRLIDEGTSDKMIDYFTDNCISCSHVNNPVLEAVQ